jgi:16S rRNA (adenine1518-N6/adenine1519-N6)-dimethyltransferase
VGRKRVIVTREKIVHPSITKEILRRYDIRLTKRFGQHFLIDENILNKEVQSAGIGSEDLVIEVGAGIGTLTQALAEKAGKVIAVEYDTRFFDVLKDTLSGYDNVEIVRADALEVDFDRLIKDKDTALFVANLPYNIATQVISILLEQTKKIKSMVVMVQKEVADRITASPGTKEYGFFTIRTAFFADVSHISVVPRTVFFPPPNVDSSILRVVRKPDIHDITSIKDDLFGFIKIFFNERRKTMGAVISRRFKDIYGEENRQRVTQELTSLGLERSVRAEALTYEQFFRLFCSLRLRQT